MKASLSVFLTGPRDLDWFPDLESAELYPEPSDVRSGTEFNGAYAADGSVFDFVITKEPVNRGNSFLRLFFGPQRDYVERVRLVKREPETKDPDALASSIRSRLERPEGHRPDLYADEIEAAELNQLVRMVERIEMTYVKRRYR